jgi:hypothetical protein
MSYKTARVALFASAMTAASGTFAAGINPVTPLGSPLDDALSRGSLLALAAVGLVVGIAIVRRKQAR